METDALGYLNVHLDNVSVRLPPDESTLYDVYFGTTPELGPEQFRTNTMDRYLDLETLAPLTTYYWQVVARRVGQVPGPVWQFTTWGVDRLVWNPVASPQLPNESFPVTVTAVDPYNNVVTNFSGPIPLSARIEFPDVEINDGSSTSPYPLASAFHDARCQVIYLASELGEARQFTALSLEVLAAPGQTLTNWTIRMKHTSLSAYNVPAWETEGWTTVYQHNETIVGETWVTFGFDTPFNYDGENNVMIDFSFNNSSPARFDGQCRVTETEGLRALNYRADSNAGDPLSWSGPSPSPFVTNQVPSIRLTPYKPPIPVTPLTSGTFVDGVWNGYVIIPTPATNVSLCCTYSPTVAGHSIPFNVSGDTDADGMPDEWENRHGLNPFNPADAGGDLDRDGVSNLAEYLANTDPNDPDSLLHIVSIRQNSPAVQIEVATAFGKSYVLQRASQLSPAADWIDLGGPFAGTGAIVQRIDSQIDPGTTYFYRIKVLR